MSNLTDKKILITCGPTWVPIDDVRVISNISTGVMGQTLAQKALKLGANVTLLEGPVVSRLQSDQITVRTFQYFDELAGLLNDELAQQSYDVIFHAAAVSDYAVKKPQPTKMKSDAATVHLDLIPLPKLIDTIRTLSGRAWLIGFKLESDMTDVSAVTATQKLFEQSKCDLVIANSVKDDDYLGFVVDKDGVVAKAVSRTAMVEGVLNIVGRQLNDQH